MARSASSESRTRGSSSTTRTVVLSPTSGDPRADTVDGGQVAILPANGHAVLQQVVEQGEARLDLLVQVDRLPHVVVAAREHTQVAHDLARPLRALLDAEDHRVEVLERVVDLERRPLAL